MIGKRTPGGGTVESDVDFLPLQYSKKRWWRWCPGRAFGSPGHFRLSYAYAMNDLIEGLARAFVAPSTPSTRK